jgi:hypothetical protein
LTGFSRFQSHAAKAVREEPAADEEQMATATGESFYDALDDRPALAFRRLEPMEVYFAVWAFVMPCTTFLLTPKIQGTTPANVLALLSLGACAFSKRYLQSGLIIAAAFLTFYIMSQVGLLANGVMSLKRLELIEPLPRSPVFRLTTITQGLYFLACLATFLFVRVHFRRGWMPYIFAGAWFLVVYGLYEWGFFLVFKRTGDFLGNRVFVSAGEMHPGSWSQIMTVGPLRLLRVKSITGEPSFFATVAVPYLALAATNRRYLLVCGLTLALLLSFSTSAYLGIVFTLGYIAYARGHLDRKILAASCVALVLLVGLAEIFPKTFSWMFAQKFLGRSMSGERRWIEVVYPIQYFSELPLLNQLFGIGFGTTYERTLRVLIDLGLVGMALYILFFAWPLLRLPSKPQLVGIKAAVAALLFYYTTGVGEIFYPSTWMFLGLAYWELDRARLGVESRETGHGGETLELRGG